MSTVASPTAAHAQGPHPSQARQNQAPQAAAPTTPFSELIDATASDQAPPPTPAAKPATASSSAKDTKDAPRDTTPSDHDSSPNAAAHDDGADTTPTGIAAADAAAKDASKDTTPKVSVATPDPDPTTDAPSDAGAKTDGDSDTAAATTAIAAATATIPTPVPTAVVIPGVPAAPVQTATPPQSETATAVAAIAGTAVAAITAPAAAAQTVADAASIGAPGVSATDQPSQGQKPAKPVAAAPAANDSLRAADTPQASDTANASPTGPAPGPLAAAGTATGSDDADSLNGSEPHAAAHAGKSTTTDKESAVDRAGSLANAQADKLAGPAPADSQTQPGPSAPAVDQAMAAAPQSPAAAAPATANAANVVSASAAQAGAVGGLVPVPGLAVEIAARAQAGTNRFEIRLDPPDLGRIDVRLNVDKQGNVTSHLVVERSATLDMLRRDAPQLERALQDAGLKTNGDGLQFSLRDQGAGAQNQSFQDNSAARSARVIIPTTDDVTLVDTARNYGRLYGLNGGLDIRV